MRDVRHGTCDVGPWAFGNALHPKGCCGPGVAGEAGVAAVWLVGLVGLVGLQ